MSAAPRRLADFAAGHGLSIEVTEFPEGTKTAADAAAAIGCPVAAIVKSLVFTVDDRPVVALVPGDLRLSVSKLAVVAGGSKVERAPLELVREATGYVAGGTPPFAHATPLEVFADPRLERHDPLWAAGGTPTTVFPITIPDLNRLSSPTWADITE